MKKADSNSILYTVNYFHNSTLKNIVIKGTNEFFTIDRVKGRCDFVGVATLALECANVCSDNIMKLHSIIPAQVNTLH